LSAVESQHVFLDYFDTQAFTVQVGQRDDVVVGLDNVTLVSLEQFKFWSTWPKHGRKSLVKFHVCQAKDLLVIARYRPYCSMTYFIPRQFRDPLEKGTRHRDIAGVTSFNQRSGLKVKGSG
jgi:hypothetical protein